MPGPYTPHPAVECAQRACETLVWSHNYAALTGIVMCVIALAAWALQPLAKPEED